MRMCVQLVYGQYVEYIRMSYGYADCVPILTGSFTGVGVGRADVEGFACEVDAVTGPVVSPGML